ncbi:hypothetical protein UP09_34375 [Bradyrhizobium sp. LTSP885]|uniref:imm11 family protein n=1 Tax=Bradyrhizobium sp. LTSP885 TaxID=1619232 RepID=UPI0005C8F079|nr:DUF1629 domain-containing protein [Bradyrhizobium sp. LTSP885]KJC33572.1 hypothetical protein UP09_34375 [Bradyrhizobium sp. LTSP885]
MVYKFDPRWFNGTIFQFNDASRMSKGWMEYERRCQPIPPSYFPGSLIVERAKAPLPDLFHTSRGLFVVSERARAIFEKLAPGEVEFIPVEIRKASTGWRNPFVDAYYSVKDLGRPVAAQFVRGQPDFLLVCDEPKPRITLRLNLASAYYFINVLGRAQRMLWLQTPSSQFGPQEDEVERFGLTQDFHKWRLCERSGGEPLIWRETWWRDGNKEYRGHNEVLVDDILWRALDERFPDQLHPLRAGQP